MAREFGDLPEGFADFPRIWREDVAPQLQALEHERRSALRLLAVAAAMGAGLGLVIGAFLGADGPFPIFLGGFCAIAGGGFGFIPVANVQKKAKAALMGPAIAALGFRHREDVSAAPAYARLRDFGQLPDHDAHRFEDRIEGDGFALCEATLTQTVRTKNGTSTVTRFSGLIGYVDCPARMTGQTVLARDMGMLNALSAPRGAAVSGRMKRAGLVDSRFEKAFELWTTDQVEARYLVTPLVIERLLDLEARFHGRKLRAVFADGALLFAVESGNLFEPGTAFRSYADPSRMRRLIAELASVRALVTTLRDLPAGR